MKILRLLTRTLGVVASGAGAALVAAERLRSPRTAPPPLSEEYPGDFVGRPVITYTPHQDQAGDPGEVVWAWVPFEEDHSRGKDRPVLLVGRDGEWLLGVPLTSKDHDRDAAQEAREGRFWVDLGSGAWDRERRPSEARVDRVVRLAPRSVRRSGVTLEKARFDVVARAVLEYAGR